MEARFVSDFVSEAQEKAVLAELRPWLQNRPPIDQFKEQLGATVQTFWAIRGAEDHYHADAKALRGIRRSAQQAKAALLAVEESSAVFCSISLGPRVRDTLKAVNELEQALSRVPEPFSEHQRTRKGPLPRARYLSFVRDLAEIADDIGIGVTTAGDRTVDPHATAFTRFVFAVERLLPREEQSASLAACAKRIDRAIAASRMGNAIARGNRRKRTDIRSRDN